MAQIFAKTRHTSKIPAGVSSAIRRGQFCEYNAVFTKIWRHFTELLLQIPGLRLDFYSSQGPGRAFILANPASHA